LDISQRNGTNTVVVLVSLREEDDTDTDTGAVEDDDNDDDDTTTEGEKAHAMRRMHVHERTDLMNDGCGMSDGTDDGGSGRSGKVETVMDG
jgi:hypothetical protein